MLCFYHADADGRCAGFWVMKSAKRNDGYELHQAIEINYGIPFPFEIIRPDEQVYIVDYSISPQEMMQLLEITENVTWIDHHKTAIEKYEGFDWNVRGVRYDGVAGCMLTYAYLNHMTIFGEGSIGPFEKWMSDEAPLFTKMIADWDVWKFDFGDDTRNFITAFNSYDASPESDFWDRFGRPGRPGDIYVRDMIQEGIIMNKQRDGWAKGYMELGFEVEFEGYSIFAANLGRCNSEYFKSLPEGKYDAFMPFVFDGDKYLVSIYSKTIDVSKIALKYGGGGHKGAAGFQCTELPFRKAAIK